MGGFSDAEHHECFEFEDLKISKIKLFFNLDHLIGLSI